MKPLLQKIAREGAALLTSSEGLLEVKTLMHEGERVLLNAKELDANKSEKEALDELEKQIKNA